MPIFDFHGTPAVRLQTPAGASAVISLFGAQVLSWTPASGNERLYLSERAIFDGKTPIRGGIPVCFPQFSDQGEGVKHGFVRRQAWELASHRAQDKFACATFRCDSSPATRTVWPHDFRAELTVMIEGDRLDIELEIANTGSQAFSFTAGLHSYLRLGNVELTRLQGLEGLDYLDATAGKRRCHDDRYALFVDDPLDRVYLGVTKPLLLSETGRQLVVEQSGFGELVVWNPWESGVTAFPDMAPLDFKRMLCVEAVAYHPVELAAAQDWCGRQTLLAL